MMVREARARVGGRDVRYLDAGAGWPVLLIHAFPVDADMWRPQLDRVPEGWRFIAPDVRGFGRDGAAGGAVTLDDVAADLAAFLDHLKLDRAVIGGLSMGGYITFALFRRAPEPVLFRHRATSEPAVEGWAVICDSKTASSHTAMRHP